MCLQGQKVYMVSSCMSPSAWYVQMQTQCTNVRTFFFAIVYILQFTWYHIQALCAYVSQQVMH